MTIEELNIIIRAKAEGVQQVTNRAKKSIQGVTQAAQQAAAAPITKAAQNQLDRLQQSLDATMAKIKQKQAELMRLDVQRDAIAAKYSGMPAATGMDKYDTTAELLSQDSEYQRLTATIAKLEAQLEPLNNKMATTKERIRQITDESRQLNGQMKKTASSLKNVREKTQQTTKSADNLSKSTQKVQKSASGTLKMLKGMLLSMVVFAAISGTMRAIGEGMQNMAQASSEANVVLSRLSAGFLYAKNAVATAFMPILQALEPVITTITDAIARACTWIAQFAAAMFGGAVSVTVAKKAQVDYAASLDKTTKAAKGQLAAFDELNVLQQPDTSGTTPGMPAPEDMFETVTIDSGIQNLVKGLKGKFEEFQNWLNTKFAPSFDAWDEALGGLKGPFDNMVASIKQSLRGLREGAFGQLLDYLKNTFLPNIVNEFSINFAPIFADTMPVMFDEFTKDFEFACNKIDQISEDVLRPAFEFVEKVATDVFKTINSTWKQYGGGILDQFTEFKESLREIWDNIYNHIIKPVCDSIGSTIDWLWENHLKSLWENISNFFASLIDAIMAIWNGFLGPLVNWLISVLSPAIMWVVNTIGGVVGSILGLVSDVIGGILKSLTGLLDFITGIFTGDWEKAWNGICQFFIGIWDALWGVIKGVINFIIDALNFLWGAIYAVFAGIANGIGGAVGWLGSLFGQNWSFSMPSSPPLIPKLASGGILTAPTVAMLGEYPGAFANPEIAAPQSVMQETFLASLTPLVEVLQEGFDRVVQAVDNKELNNYFEGKPLARALKPYLDAENARVGAPLFVR